MSQEGPVGAEAVRELLQRYAHLRSAQRALRSALGPAEHTLSVEQARKLRERLGALRARLEETEAEGGRGTPDPGAVVEKGRLGSALDDFGRRLGESLDASPLAQLRATLPEVCTTHREEVESLLEFAVGERDEPTPGRLDRIDYLVTLLATQRSGGRRRPAPRTRWLVPALCARAESAAEALDPEAAQAHLEAFREAVDRLGALQDPGPLIAAMRERKRSLGAAMLASPILEAVVEYNLAVWNRLQGLLSDERELDSEVERIPAASGGASALGPPVGEAPVAMPEDASLRGLAELEVAIEQRLCGIDARGPAAAVATMIDPGELTDLERQAFLAPGSGAGSVALRRVVALGLALRAEDVCPDALEALGVDLVDLRGPGLAEADAALQRAMQVALAEGDYATARTLGNTKARFLGTSLSESVRQRSAVRRAEALLPDDGYLERPEPRSRRSPSPSPRRSAASSNGAHGRNGLRTWAVRIALVVVFMGVLIAREPDGVRVLEPVDLAGLSPYLMSGYHALQGEGLAFFGTLGPEWLDQEARDRRRSVEVIGEALAARGVEEGMLFDSRHRLRARWSGDRIELPTQGK